MNRLGVDVGGTFTDLILVGEEGKSIAHKIPTTPQDLSKAVVQGVFEICQMAGIEPNEIDQFFHGTTIATNIVLEHSGANVGMITTEGFRDILHIARHKRPYNFSLYQELPWQKHPLAKRRNRLTVSERVTAKGEILKTLDEEEVRNQVKKLKKANVDAIAVCFLFSYKNPEHENKVKEIIEEEYPEAFLSISNEVLPQYREYERFSTVALNAFVGPKTSNYIKKLYSNLKDMGIENELHLMQSNGGIATSGAVEEKPVNLLLSGPVAGLIGGIDAAKNAGFKDIITLDAGGTSADIGVAPDGQMRMRHLLDTMIGDYNAMVPMVEIDTIGAGGGSIAHVDEGGIFRVGPQSAGADPGPASYNHGGKLPTLTDANVLLGRIRSDGKLAGGLEMRTELAEEAFEKHIASKLDMTTLESAAGAVKIMTHNMVNAIEMNSVRKGYDPREFVLVAEGGAGPLFACDIAAELKIPHVVVPPYPGITASVGLLSTDITYENISTLWESLSNPNTENLSQEFKKLERDAEEALRADGIKEENIVLKRICDCRYAGQGYELRVEAPEGDIDQKWTNIVIERFHDAHEREYAKRFPSQEVISINVRVIGVGLIQSGKEISFDKTRIRSNPIEHPVYFWVGDNLKELSTKFYERNAIEIGTELLGPAVIRQNDSTIIIPPDVKAYFDEHGNIIMSLGRKIKEKEKALASTYE